MPKIVRVVFGVPTEGHTQAEALQSLRLMCFHHGVLQAESKVLNKDVQFEFSDSTCGRMFTPFAREKMALDALANNADYLFMIDDDMLSPYDAFERLYRHDVDIVAALAFTRNPPYNAVLYQTKEGWDSTIHRKYVFTDWIRDWPRGKLVECDAVGFGCVLIKMDVIRKMARPYFMCSSGTGEDIWFCIRAKEQTGAKVFMDTTFEVGHMSSPIVVDTKLHDEHNDPEKMSRLYGPYKKFGVYNVSHLPEAEKAMSNGNGKDLEETLAL